MKNGSKKQLKKLAVLIFLVILSNFTDHLPGSNLSKILTIGIYVGMLYLIFDLLKFFNSNAADPGDKGNKSDK